MFLSRRFLSSFWACGYYFKLKIVVEDGFWDFKELAWLTSKKLSILSLL
jgi:hypothetical protein